MPLWARPPRTTSRPGRASRPSRPSRAKLLSRASLQTLGVVMRPEHRDLGSRPRIGLVLGAGGVLGAAWMAGALPAVQERLPCAINDAQALRSLGIRVTVLTP